MNTLLLILQSIQSGIPVWNEIKDLFKKKNKVNASLMTKDELVLLVEKELNNTPSFYEKIFKLLITGLTVYAMIVIAKTIGITYNDVETLWGILNK